MNMRYTYTHVHTVEDEYGDLVDVVIFCSDRCHRDYCVEQDVEYEGWYGLVEHEYDPENGAPVCAQCGEAI